jgi:TolA-binding protein
MLKKSLLLLLLIFICFSNINAQKSTIYLHVLTEYNHAISLYHEGQFQSARFIFDKVKLENQDNEVQSDCAFYSANCGIKLLQSNADVEMIDFISDYPTSIYQNEAFQLLANLYFEQSDFAAALPWFEKIEEGNLDSDSLEKLYFQKAYVYFVSKNKKEAISNFDKVLRSEKYGSQAKYYLGFMAYEGDDYKKANNYFDAVSEESQFKEKLSYFKSDMSFKSGEFQKAIDLGILAMAKSTASEKSELNKIIGESYFNLEKYDQAIPFLNQYKGKKGKWSNTDYYQLGFAYYQQKDFENTILNFNKIIGGNDFVAQNAYYHLGESYLKTDKKQQALHAFKNASEMSFELKIQEDAFLNYAKLSYDIGNSYQSIPDILSAFIAKYPNSSSKETIETLLINSFVSSKNYKGALELLEKNNAFSNKLIYQKVTFYRGLELFTDSSYQDALAMFNKSIGTGVVSKFSSRATFWKAESEFILDNFKDALLSFKQFDSFEDAKSTPEYKNMNYNIAYCYFKLKEYEQAGNYFQNYIGLVSDDKVRLKDAYLRLADSRFVSAKYWPAMDAYNKVIELKSVDSDYAAFQKAISYGFVDKNDKKIDDLNKFVSVYLKSQYRDDALFELGNAYVIVNKNDLALKTYDQLIAEFKNGSYASKAILRQGLIYFNSEKDELAISKLKKVAAEFPKSAEALEAVSTARTIYVDNGKVEEYANWVKTLDFISVSDADLDNDTFEAAEKQYLQNNSKQAISNFSGYVAKFPNGLHALKANFYLAQSYYSEGLESNSVSNYEYIISNPRNEFTEQSLVRLAQIYLKLKENNKAILVLSKLETEADFPQNVTFAQANLMKLYYEQEEYLNSVIYAEKVMNNPKTDNKVKSDAQIIVARSAVKTNDEVKARSAYSKLATIASGELAAEALYYDAHFKNKDGNFEASNLAVQKLTKDYSGYKYFGAKGLIVMAKNFYGLKDSFQATYILESIIKNFSSFTDVITDAQNELELIKAEESKTNSSVKE